MRAFLKSGNKTLTETWSYPWRAEAKEPPAPAPQPAAAPQQPAQPPTKE
jgi:glucans biosynthesis protein